jgi:hypothetical protein
MTFWRHASDGLAAMTSATEDDKITNVKVELNIVRQPYFVTRDGRVAAPTVP